jgi:outer membrane lipoprotein carrier protein
MKRLLTCFAALAFLAAPALSYATAAAPAAETDPLDATPIFAGVQKRYARVQTLRADFTQVFRGARTVRESGVLTLKKPGRMRWDYRDPQSKMFLSDGKKTYLYYPARNSVMVEAVRESRDPRAPFMFLLGNSRLQRAFSSVRFAQEVPSSLENMVVLRLTPQKPIENLDAILVECNRKDFSLSRITLAYASGDRSDFLLSNIVENAPVPDDTFSFTPPPGVKVER